MYFPLAFAGWFLLTLWLPQCCIDTSARSRHNFFFKLLYVTKLEAVKILENWFSRDFLQIESIIQWKMMLLHFLYISRYVIDGNSNMSLYVAFFSLDISRICAKEKKITAADGAAAFDMAANDHMGMTKVIQLSSDIAVLLSSPWVRFSLEASLRFFSLPRRNVRLLRERSL